MRSRSRTRSTTWSMSRIRIMAPARLLGPPVRELDRFAVGGRARRRIPLALAAQHLGRVDQSLHGGELFERGEPEFVIARAVVDLAARGRRPDLGGERLGPLAP